MKIYCRSVIHFQSRNLISFSPETGFGQKRALEKARKRGSVMGAAGKRTTIGSPMQTRAPGETGFARFDRTEKILRQTLELRGYFFGRIFKCEFNQ